MFGINRTIAFIVGEDIVFIKGMKRQFYLWFSVMLAKPTT